VKSPDAALHPSTSSYQILLVALLSISFGILFFDRNSLAFLMPFVQPDLKLNNTQVGTLASALSFTWACAALGIGYISDKTGSRKGLLIIATMVFSICSFLSGMAQTFVAMLGARMLMGVAEGGFMPICQAMIAAEVKPKYRGLAMGVTQNFGSNLLGSFVAPVLLVGFAESFGWRNAFFLAGAPGLVAALLMWVLIRKPAAANLAASRAESKPAGSLGAALAEPNVVICAILSVLMVSYLVVCWTFMPLYLTQVRHFDPKTMGWLMGTLGISATIGAFLISGLSDFIGRRPLMIAMPLIGVVLPVGAMFYDGSAWVLAAMFFVGWGLCSIFPLFMATVPSESVDRAHIATALGLCMGLGEIIGGAAAPFIAGYVADRVGLQAPLWIMTGLTVVSGLLAFGLRETAPRVLMRRAAIAVPTHL
jgi:ACS family hexuronate transporter-like MFS transporter